MFKSYTILAQVFLSDAIVSNIIEVIARRTYHPLHGSNRTDWQCRTVGCGTALLAEMAGGRLPSASLSAPLVKD